MRASRCGIFVATFLGALSVLACGDEDDPGSQTEAPNGQQECGGCARPPECNPDGTSPPAPCSCGCFAGDTHFKDGFVCTDRGCLVPIPEGGLDAGEG